MLTAINIYGSLNVSNILLTHKYTLTYLLNILAHFQISGFF